MLPVILAILFFMLFFYYLNIQSHDTPSFYAGSFELPTRYKKYVIRTKPKFRDYCFPAKYKLQQQQLFLSDYMAPANVSDRGIRELLVYHKIGAGKTCTAIQICERYKNPLIIAPASLLPGYYAEFRTGCGMGKYLPYTPIPPISSAEYKDFIIKSNALIDNKYNIISYNRFVSHIPPLSDVVVVDEIQNVTNPSGKFYNKFINYIHKYPDTVIVLMSATPIINYPHERDSLLSMLRQPPDSNFIGRVSYYPGAPSITYPKLITKLVKCPMSQFQSSTYRSQVENELSKYGKLITHKIDNSFYIKSRQRSIISFPNNVNNVDVLSPKQLCHNIAKYSAKYAFIGKKIQKNNRLTFIYIPFTGSFGIRSITKYLRAIGFKDYFQYGAGPHRYVVWSGNTTKSQKSIIATVFNDQSNDNGGQIQVVIGSPAMKEGVSLLRVNQAFIAGIPWNHAMLSQIVGRVSRYCSHKRLKPADRIVKVYLLASVNKSERDKKSPKYSVDLYMLGLADKKMTEISPILADLRQNSIDRALWK